MSKGKVSNIAVFFMILLVIGAGIAILVFTNNDEFVVNEAKAFNKPSLSTVYHTQLDRMSESYIDDRRVSCSQFDGTWYDQKSAIGCFDIRLDWDSGTCGSVELELMENTCESVGATWVCDEQNVGCMY